MMHPDYLNELTFCIFTVNKWSRLAQAAAGIVLLLHWHVQHLYSFFLHIALKAKRKITNRL
jgi:hypothetical protein